MPAGLWGRQSPNGLHKIPHDVRKCKNFMKRKSVLGRYFLCLCVLLLLFVFVFGVVKAQENSQRMRTGKQAQTIDAQDVSAFIGQYADTWERPNR